MNILFKPSTQKDLFKKYLQLFFTDVIFQRGTQLTVLNATPLYLYLCLYLYLYFTDLIFQRETQLTVLERFV